MKATILYCFLIFALMSLNCQRISNKSNIEGLENLNFKNYNEFVEMKQTKLLVRFGNLMNHFPVDLKKLELLLHSESSGYIEYVNACFLLIKIRAGDTLQNYFLKTSIAIYDANDTCNFVLYKTTHQKSDYPLELETEYTKYNVSQLFGSCTDTRYPVPNFLMRDTVAIDTTFFNLETFSLNTGCHLDESFKLVILDAKPGIHFDIQKNDFNIEGLGKWSKGYSKGVAISEQKNELMYWVIAW